MAFDKKNGGASSSGGGRFIKEPRAFDGLNEERAATWLSRMNRLKRSAKINDEEMLLIVEENLIDKAESWWNVEGSKAENWEKFESLFKNQYLSDLEDRWWSAIYALKQGDEYRSVDEVAIRMEELFNLLGNKDQGLLVRTFLNAINPNIAYEIEKESKPATFAIAKERARQVEKSQLKYGVARQDANEVVYKVKSQEPVMDKHDFPDSKSEASTMSSVMSLVDKLEKLSINLVALQDAVANNSRNSSYGVPARLLSDRGANFISTYVHQFLKQIGCKNIMVTSYRASANGMVEKLNHSLVSVLAKIARDERNIDQWDKYVDAALMVLRSTKNTGTGYSPSYLLYGYEFRTPAVWVSPRLDYVEGEEAEELKERIEMIGDKLQNVRDKAREYSDERKAKAKIRYDANVHFIRQYEIGEQVLLKNPFPDSKFGDKWEGPYKVVQVNKSSGTYHLTGRNSLRLKHAVNGDRLKPYNNEVQRMIPDVMVSQASDQFQRWIEANRVNMLVTREKEFFEISL